jgi:hypothetical protein
VRTGFVWLRIGISGGLLWKRWWDFSFLRTEGFLTVWAHVDLCNVVNRVSAHNLVLRPLCGFCVAGRLTDHVTGCSLNNLRLWFRLHWTRQVVTAFGPHSELAESSPLLRCDAGPNTSGARRLSVHAAVIPGNLKFKNELIKIWSRIGPR